MNILFVTTHMPPDYHYGGVVNSGSQLFYGLAQKTETNCLCVSKDPNRVRKFKKNKNVYVSKSYFFHSYAFSPRFILLCYKHMKEADVIFVNGTVTFPTIIAQILCLILKKDFFISVRGALEPWRMKQKAWKKKLYYKFFVFPLLKKANGIHTTANSERQSVSQAGFSKTFIVSNGISFSEYKSLPQRNTSLENGKFVFLFLSRMDKEKGLDILLDAFSRFNNLNDENDDYMLLLVGPDNQNYFNRNFNLNSIPNVKYIDGVYGADKTALYRNSDFFILPSYSENFGNVIAEALACELPVITTTGTPWSEISSVKCGFYIKPNVNELLDAMLKAYNMVPSERHTMGARGRKYILENFLWEQKCNELYNILSHKAN